MPTYQYACDVCQHTFEILQSMLDKKLRKCPQCGKYSLRRLIGAGSGIIFKGNGFYETDYKRKSAPAASGVAEASDQKASSQGCGHSSCGCGAKPKTGREKTKSTAGN